MSNSFSAPPDASSAAPIRSRFAGDEDYRELLEMFVEDIPERIAALQATLEAETWTEMRYLAHQLKGAGGGYGFDSLSQSAGVLEQASDSQDTDRILSSCNTVIAQLRRVTV